MDYKDKLRLAKEALDSGSYDKETIEYIFPELAESEDERIRKVITDIVKAQPSDSLFNGTKEKCLAWLEKQQKPADNQFTPEQAGVLDKHIDKFLEQNHTWSEEDEQYVKDTLALLAFGVSVHTISQVQDWLNSLKDKYIWKPSDEHMIAIQEAMNIVGILTITGSKLNSLYQDLKKLREE